MARRMEPERAALLVSVICGSRTYLLECSRDLEEFGTVALESEVLSFDFTRYYEKTMGAGLFRRFVLFAPGFDPESLADVKIRTGILERDLSHKTGLAVERPLNLDPGYLTLSKLVLASTKDHAHRIPIGRGIFGEVTLHFRDRSFRSWPWTFPDYASREYIDFFNAARAGLLVTS